MFMPALWILTATMTTIGSQRTIVFLLLLLAIVLIVSGAIIALLTLAAYRKAHTSSVDQSSRD